MAAPRKRIARPAAKKVEGFAMVKMPDGTEAPDIAVALETYGKWHEVKAKVGAKFDLTESQIFNLYMKQEVVKDPSLRFTATPEAVIKARRSGLRWERIAIRTGESIPKLRKMYEDGADLASDSDYVGKGRRFKPMVEGGLPVNYKAVMEYDETAGTWVPKAGTNGSAPKRTARKAKVATDAKPAARRVARKAKVEAPAE